MEEKAVAYKKIKVTNFDKKVHCTSRVVHRVATQKMLSSAYLGFLGFSGRPLAVCRGRELYNSHEEGVDCC